MKTFILPSLKILCIFFIIASQQIKAQSALANLSFETWTTTTNYAFPVGWMGTLINQETTGAQHLSSYVRISTNTLAAGMLLIGASNSSTFSNGDSYTLTPSSLNGFYKTSGMVAGDTMSIIGMTSKNYTLDCIGSQHMVANSNGWTSFSMPFAKVGNFQADTIQIIFMNLQGNAVAAKFDVDNLSVMSTTPVGIDIRSLGTPFLVYPNPVSNQLNILSHDENASQIQVLDLTGKSQAVVKINGEHTSVDLQHLAPGVYFYMITDRAGNKLLQNKLIVE